MLRKSRGPQMVKALFLAAVVLVLVAVVLVLVALNGGA